MRTVVTPGRAFALALLVATATLIHAAPAQAHSADEWYSVYRWAPGDSVDYGFDLDFPTGAPRDRTVDAEADWNANGHEFTPTFHATLPDADFPSMTAACPNPQSGFIWNSATTDALGVARICVSGNEIIRFSVGINPDFNWYAGTGTPGTGQYDLQSTLAHELGHITGGWGWGADHFSGSTLCPANIDRQTMCAGSTGNDWRRNIDVHDVDTFHDAYAPADDCEVTYTITNAWPGNFQADVEVHNTGTSTIQGWTLDWTYDGDETVYNEWNVNLTQTGADVTATDVGSNATILPGGQVSFGLQGTVTGSASVPAPITCTY